jgi:ABC-type glutathione transport system ATPase component
LPNTSTLAKGLGQLIQNARRFSAMDQVFAGIHRHYCAGAGDLSVDGDGSSAASIPGRLTMSAAAKTPAPRQVSIAVRNIIQEYPKPEGGVTRVLDSISLDFDKPGINMLLGPSGCGKSTLLHMLGGVRPMGVADADFGFSILIDGDPNAMTPHVTIRSWSSSATPTDPT